MRTSRLLAWLATALLGIATPAAAAPKVVVSIKPIHALVAGVMDGLGEPALVVSGGRSPHDYALRPSDATRLAEAEIVFWIGPIFEGFLVKPLDALAGKAEIVELDRAPGVTLLPARHGGAWEEDEDGHADTAAASPLEQDGHLWLDPENARAIVRLAAARLAALDPANALRYRVNGIALEHRLAALDDALRQKLAGVRHAPFVVFHDAYQYFEKRYALSAIGSITVNPEHPPGARRLAAMRDKIATLGARCVFREPMFEPRLVQTLIAGREVRTGVLDPEGTALPAGRELYFTLMSGLADALTSCLRGG
jgi:zinc transport system substrate-binding protein